MQQYIHFEFNRCRWLDNTQTNVAGSFYTYVYLSTLRMALYTRLRLIKWLIESKIDYCKIADKNLKKKKYFEDKFITEKLVKLR